MPGAIIGDLAGVRNNKFCIEWPESDNLLAVLKGQLLECFRPGYWDDTSGSLEDVLGLLEQTLENNLMPAYCAIPGEVRAYAGQPGDVSDYEGWLLCNGQCLLQSDHPELFSAIGLTWGDGGNPATNFQVPALNGRVVVGWAGGVGSFKSVGEKGGSENVTLTQAELPNHTHALGAADGVYRTNMAYRATQATGAGLLPAGGTVVTNLNPIIGNSGGGGAHTNVQPYAVMTYMIYSGRPPGTGCQ